MSGLPHALSWPEVDKVLVTHSRELCSNLRAAALEIQSSEGIELLRKGVGWEHGHLVTDNYALAEALDLWTPVLLFGILSLFLLRWLLRGFTKLRLQDMQGSAGAAGRPIRIGAGGDSLSSEPTYLLTIILLAGLLAAFYTQTTGSLPGTGPPPNWAAFLQLLPNQNSELYDMWCGMTHRLARGEYWRFFTPALLHGNLLHLLANVRLWWSFRAVEAWFGFLGYLLIIAASAFGSSVASFMFAPSSASVSIGASGVVCGLIGADMVVSRFGECLQRIVALGAFTALCFIIPLPIAIDHWAHWGGLVAGYIMASFLAALRLLLGPSARPAVQG